MILDMQTFQELKELMGENLNDLIERYFALSENYIVKIEQAIATNTSSMAEEAAHPLKSSSLQVSAVHLHRVAAIIEAEAQTGAITPKLREQAAMLRPTFEAAVAALRQALVAA